VSNTSTRFDWADIHAALAARLKHLGSGIEANDARLQAMLRERAEHLAKAPHDVAAQDPEQRLLVLRIGTERYALALECAQEVTLMTHAAVLPGSGPEIHGIVSWRGEFVTVFDLAQILGVDSGADPASRRLVVLRGEEPRVGLVVDGVEHVAALRLSQLQPAEDLRTAHAEYFKGATADALIVLDEDRLLPGLRERLQAA